MCTVEVHIAQTVTRRVKSRKDEGGCVECVRMSNQVHTCTGPGLWHALSPRALHFPPEPPQFRCARGRRREGGRRRRHHHRWSWAKVKK